MLQKIFQQSLLAGFFLGSCFSVLAAEQAHLPESPITIETEALSTEEIEAIVLETALKKSPELHRKLTQNPQLLKQLAENAKLHFETMSKDKRAKCTFAAAVAQYVGNLIGLLCFLFIYTEYILPKIKTFDYSDFWTEIGKICSGVMIIDPLKNYARDVKGVCDSVYDAALEQALACK